MKTANIVATAQVIKFHFPDAQLSSGIASANIPLPRIASAEMLPKGVVASPETLPVSTSASFRTGAPPAPRAGSFPRLETRLRGEIKQAQIRSTPG